MESIAISYIGSFGERGSALGEFEYPRGMSPIGASIAICDTQNDRVQVSDLISTASAIGVGLLSFPDSILWNSAKSSFFITDSDNHVIREYSLSGTIKSTIGSRGTGDLEFDFKDTKNNKKNIKICKEIWPRGSIVVFPSFVWHRVKPVTKGTRHSLVMWSIGAPFKWKI